MGLLGGDLALVLHTAFSGLFLDGTLHGGTGDPIYGPGGTIIGYEGGDTPVKVQTDSASDQMRAGAGFSEGDVRLLVLAKGVPSITSDHQITDGNGDLYSIQSAEQDAARSHYVIRGRLL
ncbi:hypothetical protein [Novosphingobium decolorationis]|uniref:Phage tail protein n=1 Tax=Novosphingobium decolorationis TaxID=2698673 RepID=A0ABX8E1P2_9SPHN|nr:hypothetical protein [Novosphingobium decolorationis]QVM82998.1 hypothetical protein HT578_04080 [Novosphingobium decolorationis]